ncbi:hypothetical protein JCM10213_004227, partial [Rhodosporidiobolus nylandii]
GRRKWLTSGAVVNTFNEVLQELGKERIWGHSFRIGGGNFYAVNGVHPDRIRQSGRWEGKVVDKYMRNQNLTAIKYLSNIQFTLDPSLKEASFAKFYGFMAGNGEKEIEAFLQKEIAADQHRNGKPAGAKAKKRAKDVEHLEPYEESSEEEDESPEPDSGAGEEAKERKAAESGPTTQRRSARTAQGGAKKK